MTKEICETVASSWFCYGEVRYDARSHERKIVRFMLWVPL